MDVKEFKKAVHAAKGAPYKTGSPSIPNKKARVNHEHTIYTFIHGGKCSQCGHEDYDFLTVEFYKPHRVTIFEAGLLFMVFAQNRRPIDYASYHDCPAGREFIENIKSIQHKGELIQ